MNVVDKASEYHYRVYYDEEVRKYTATCLELPSLSFIDDFSRTKAYVGILDVVCDSLNEMEEEDIPVAFSFSRERKEARKKEDKKLKKYFEDRKPDILEDWHNIIVKKKA